MYSDHETYFNYEINVYNGPYLPYGVHNFPFSFTLPYNIPSSFESKDGQVRYEVRGKNLTMGKNYTRDRNVCPGLNLFQPGVKSKPT